MLTPPWYPDHANPLICTDDQSPQPATVPSVRIFQMAGPEGPRTVLVVGEGLLGGALVERLGRRNPNAERHVATDWTAPASALGADAIHLSDGLEPGSSTEIFWTAGTAGMQLPSFDPTDYRTTFAQRIEAVSSAMAERGASVRLHLASSAGALGSLQPSRRGVMPASPYAERKAIEEDVVLHADAANRVYRIASAYGAPTRSRRAGVIGLLLQNALLGRETELFARPSTMRNYVHHHDVAEAMLRSLDASTEPTLLLASQRSHAMSEVLAEVSRVVRRAVPVIHRPPANDHDMVFDPAETSPLLPQRSLAAGVRATYDTLLSR